MVIQQSAAQPATSPLYVYSGAFVDELRRAGLRHVVICPGSRSTPLALAFAALETQGGPRVWMHVDERSAAYFGLGLAKRLREPVALVCTSGTAAANFYPAVVEAHLSRVPMLVLTADRPHELRDNGAPQAIDQTRLYGAFAKWFVDAALPEATNEALRSIRTLACRAWAIARGVPEGPVHLNFPFREPLIPAPADLPPEATRDPIAWRGRPHRVPYVQVVPTTAGSPQTADVARAAALLAGSNRAIIVAGPGCPPGLSEPLTRLAERLHVPLLADPLSGVRASQGTINAYDAFLRSESFSCEATPDLVLRFGAMPTSKPLLQFLQRHPHCPQIVVDDAGMWAEPTQLASDLLRVDAPQFATALLAALPSDYTTRDVRWLNRWRTADESTQQAIDATMHEFAAPFEGRVFRELAAILPDGAALVVGNSMPVRDCDTFFWPTAGRHIEILGNRGANGIDGVISTALGIAAAQPDTPTVLVIGDLSFFHDLNGLLAAKLHELNLTVVLINNDGGGIFSFLPQATYPDHFERLFGTPTGLDFAPVVRMYGGSFASFAAWDDFRAALRHSIGGTGLRVVELRTERASNVAMHRQVWHAVDDAAAAVLTGGTAVEEPAR
jgi:2-succinyl-5-enolpyruvyl-6-hydroxy-3-cyclohexene-1-carboxylate synthase